MLKEDGKVIGDFSLARPDEETFLIVGSGIAETLICVGLPIIFKMAAFRSCQWVLPAFLGLSIGAKGKEVLAKLAAISPRMLQIHGCPWSNSIYCWPVTYTGDLGYELWMALNISVRSL